MSGAHGRVRAASAYPAHRSLSVVDGDDHRRTDLTVPGEVLAKASCTCPNRPETKVSQAGRDERTRLRFSRISITRCTDLARFPAPAWVLCHGQSIRTQLSDGACPQLILRLGAVTQTADSVRRPPDDILSGTGIEDINISEGR